MNPAWGCCWSPSMAGLYVQRHTVHHTDLGFNNTAALASNAKARHLALLVPSKGDVHICCCNPPLCRTDLLQVWAARLMAQVTCASSSTAE